MVQLWHENKSSQNFYVITLSTMAINNNKLSAITSMTQHKWYQWIMLGLQLCHSWPSCDHCIFEYQYLLLFFSQTISYTYLFKHSLIAALIHTLYSQRFVHSYTHTLLAYLSLLLGPLSLTPIYIICIVFCLHNLSLLYFLNRNVTNYKTIHFMHIKIKLSKELLVGMRSIIIGLTRVKIATTS